MQSLITSAFKSKTELSMVKNADIPFYENSPSMPIIGTQHQIVNPYINVTGPAMGQSITLKAPAGAGFMTNMSFSFLNTYTIDSVDDKNALIAFNMTRSLEILSGGNLIVFRTGKALLANFLSMKKTPFQKYSLKHARMLVPGSEVLAATAQTEFVTYLPFDECFLDSKERFLLLNAVDLQFRITFEDYLKAGLKNNTYSVVAKCFMDTYVPTLEVFDKMVLKDWSNQRTIEFTNSHTEIGTFVNTTSAKHTVQSSTTASQTDIFVQRITTVAGTSGGGSDPVAAYGCPFARIHTVTIILNGIPFYQEWPVSRVNELGARNGNESIALSSSATPSVGSSITYIQGVLSINWGILANKFENSGVVAWENLQGTTIEITFEDIVQSNLFSMYVVHHTNQLVDYVPSSAGAGYMIISATN